MLYNWGGPLGNPKGAHKGSRELMIVIKLRDFEKETSNFISKVLIRQQFCAEAFM